MSPTRPTFAIEDDTSLGDRAAASTSIREASRSERMGVLGAWAPSASRLGAARFRRRWQREPITVREVMEATARWASPESTLCDVCRIMRDEECAVVPVLERSRRLVGIVLDRDVVLAGLSFDDSRASRAGSRSLAADVMALDFDCAVADEAIEDVAILMGSRHLSRLPVVGPDDRFLGMISMARIARHADDHESLQDALGRVASSRAFWQHSWR